MFVFNIQDDFAEEDLSEDDIINSLTSTANIINAFIFTSFLTGANRTREKRLDVPDKLKGVNCSFGLLKRAVNEEMRCPRFNIRINYKQYYYILVDELKYVPEQTNFIHTVDEIQGGENNDN